MTRKKKAQRTCMNDFMEVFRLRFEKRMSYRNIAVALGIGCSTVHEIIGRFSTLGLPWPLPADYSTAFLEQNLFPGRDYEQNKTHPDWLLVDAELSRKGVTKQLLWIEYQSVYGEQALGYTQFCWYFRKWKKSQRLSMRQHHIAGEKLFIDFCGPTVPVINPDTGELRKAAIFIAVMGASSYTYIEACAGQDLESWLNANSRCLHFLGGVPELLIPDNLKSGVNKADRYEPELNASYQQLAEHYKTVILPARPRRPRDKAKVEAGVLVVERWVLARIRNETFYTIAALNQRLRELCGILNRRPMKGYGGQSRAERFRLLDAPALSSLPEYAWEYQEYRVVKVAPDYHVEYKSHWYSVPHELVGERLELKAGQQLIQIWHRGVCVAQHPRNDQPWKHTTHPGHMPENHRMQGKWTPERLQNWASSIGPSVLKIVEQIQRSKAHPEQAYRAVLGLLNLQKKYGSERLETASMAALYSGHPNRSFIDNLLKNKREQLLLAEVPQSEQKARPLDHENIRGPGYYH